MIALAQSAPLFLLAWLAFLALGMFVAALLRPLGASRLPTWEPAARYRMLVVFAALPVATATILLLAAVLPSLVSLVLPALDHCPAHDDGHLHLCFVHLPAVAPSATVLLVVSALALYLTLQLTITTRRALRTARVLSVLERTGHPRCDLGVTVIETPEPVCLAVGLLRPRILLARSLLLQLDASERTVVLAHERAHVVRRDALVGALVRCLSTFHLPHVGRWLVRELDVAAEQACDERAASAVGDRLLVAATILQVERALGCRTSEPYTPLALAFGAAAVERRVAALLVDSPRPRSLGALKFLFAIGGFCALVGAAELHHLTESLLSVVAH